MRLRGEGLGSGWKRWCKSSYPRLSWPGIIIPDCIYLLYFVVGKFIYNACMSFELPIPDLPSHPGCLHLLSPSLVAFLRFLSEMHKNQIIFLFFHSPFLRAPPTAHFVFYFFYIFLKYKYTLCAVFQGRRSGGVDFPGDGIRNVESNFLDYG